MVTPPTKIKINHSVPVYVFKDRNEYAAWVLNDTEIVPSWTLSDIGVYHITHIISRPYTGDTVFVREYTTPQEHYDAFLDGYIAWAVCDRDAYGTPYPITIL